ncbi:hypothetical protein ACJZ2D_016351 [Fusarium nematophilum]
MSNWNSLPAEMRLAILEQLLQSPDVAPYAAVSKEWQAIIEKRNFHRLKLKQSCLDEFELIKQQRGLVKHVSLNIELRRYTCRCCRREESETWRRLNEKTIAAAVSKPFSILSTWAPTTGGMTLELNAYSPSDSEHRLKNCYFGAPALFRGTPAAMEMEPSTVPDVDVAADDPNTRAADHHHSPTRSRGSSTLYARAADHEACTFKYSRKDASIAWQGTWEVKLEPCVLHVWEKVSLRHTRIELWADTQLLGHEIRSHGDAIHYLDLPSSVIDPVSLWQIRRGNP